MTLNVNLTVHLAPEVLSELKAIRVATESAAASIAALVKLLEPSPVTGIGVEPGPVSTH